MTGLSELDAMKAAFDALSKLEPEERSRAIKWLVEALNVEVAAPDAPQSNPGGQPGATVTAAAGRAGMAAEAKAKTPKAFLAEKKPSTAIERVACLAYYLTHSRDTPTFKTKDIVALNTEAALPKLANAARDVNNAASAGGFLASAGSGAKQITTRGEALVEALPDRDAVKQALEDHKFKRRAASRSTSRRLAKRKVGS